MPIEAKVAPDEKNFKLKIYNPRSWTRKKPPAGIFGPD
jgi:hypothetical protein